MDRYFSIGEMAKLYNISVETLRHYDRFDLLKPDYINEKTGYRYYSIKSFLKMDLIKRCKAIDLSLDEIKEIIDEYTSLESVLRVIKNQKEMIDKKIVELNEIKNSIVNLENSIEEALHVGIDEPFNKYNQERVLKVYNYTGRYSGEFQINLRKSLLELETKYSRQIPKVAFMTSYEDIIQNNKVTYKKTMIQVDDTLNNKEEIIVLPTGIYATLYFDDNFYDNKKYYDKLINYINENNIKTIGDFYEIYEITRVSNDGEEKSLAKIEILIEEYKK